MAKKYITPQLEIKYNDEPKGGSGNTRLPYGLCKK